MQIINDEASNPASIASTSTPVQSDWPRTHPLLAGRRAKGLLLASLAALCLNACSVTGIGTGPESATNSTRVADTSISAIDLAVINDHVDVIKQILDPLNTTLQITNSDTDARLGVIAQLLADSGYGIQRVTADQGANYLAYNREQRIDEQQDLITFTTQIGTIEISRDYWTPSQTVVEPASTFRLSGTRAEVTVDSNDITNKRIVDASLSTTSYIASLGLDEQSPIISLVTSDLVDRVTSDTLGSSRLAPTDPTAPTLQALNSNREQINNLFFADTSTFSSVLDGYEKVERQIIIFGNDSLVLGNTNKSLINQFVANSVRNDDIISLIGCSNGNTNLDIGNEGLALGRAKRVTEALLARGIGRERILDEGCWAPVTAGDRFPSRGVVVELWRKNS